MAHVPPYPKFPCSYGDNGTLTQFLARRVIRFTPSRLQSPNGWMPGPSIAPVIRQGKGRRPEKQHAYRLRKNSAYRRNRAEVGRMLNEVREDGKL